MEQYIDTVLTTLCPMFSQRSYDIVTDCRNLRVPEHCTELDK
jgi:hypothetical protein